VLNDELGATNAPLISEAICSDPEIIPGVNPELASNEVTLVENDADGSVNEPDIFVAVKLLINVALEPNEPDIPDEVNPELPPPSSNDVTLVENDPLSVFKLVILVLNELLGATNAPDISVAICADPDNNVLAVTISFAVILVENEELAALNDPLIPDALNTGLPSNVVTLVLNDALGVVKEPDISDAN